jgi:hypothetical protein
MDVEKGSHNKKTRPVETVTGWNAYEKPVRQSLDREGLRYGFCSGRSPGLWITLLTASSRSDADQ